MPKTPSKQRAPCSANNASPRDSAAMAAASPRAPDRGVIGTGALAAQSPKSHRHAKRNRPRRRPPRKIDCAPADFSPPPSTEPARLPPPSPIPRVRALLAFRLTLHPRRTLHPPPSTLHPPPSTLPNRPHPSPPYRRRNPTRCSTSSSRQAPTLFDKSSTRARLPKKRLENSPRGSPPGLACAVPTTASLFASPL
jgi:hypothetical protein